MAEFVPYDDGCPGIAFFKVIVKFLILGPGWKYGLLVEVPPSLQA